MNMTGDPNQRNKPMFGFECSYPSPSMGFPRFSEQAANSGSPFASTTGIGDPNQCLFSTNSSSPFPMNNTFQSPLGNVPYSSGYAFASTSSMSLPQTCTRNVFSFTQCATTTELPGSSMSSVPGHNTNPFVVNHWAPNVKSNVTFAASNASAIPSTSTFSVRPLTGSFGCKRKTESPPLVPLKQHITEERMAEHMSRLHISSQTPTSTKESEPVRVRRLYMCEEMQRLQTDSIIPAQILEKVQRPCTALVPWRPPVVPSLSKENNNNEEEPDLMERSDSNIMDMDS